MPKSTQIEVDKLKLDLKNFRTVPQRKESDAIKAMISIKPDRFFAIMESMIDDGYLPTENIIILEKNGEFIVKEGNRRIAALKLIHGFHNISDFGLPSSVIDSINKIDPKWKTENINVPCTVFSEKEEDKVDRVVTLAHGKGEKASRDPWNSIARARHNRDVKKGMEYGLDLLEKYLKKGQNINNQQKERWGGDYPLTVLDEALRKSFARLGFANVTELVKSYPLKTNLAELENILLDIGLEQIKFETLRNINLDFPTNYGIPPAVIPNTSSSQLNQASSNTNISNNNNNNNNTISGQTNTNNIPSQNNSPTITSSTNTNTTSTPAAAAAAAAASPKAVAVNDPKHVANLLKKFSPRGSNRQKVVTLRDELKKLKIIDNPIAFCFILRSMFEISGKAYSNDHNISLTKSGGKEKTLVDMLRGITIHLTNNNSNMPMVKVLHGAMTELAKADGLLSVTSMNNLVHSPVFTISPTDLCTVFSNIYPLLEAMN